MQWHELKVGDIVDISHTGNDSETLEVLCFRKVMAIVIVKGGCHELFTPKEFNDLYSAKLAYRYNKYK